MLIIASAPTPVPNTEQEALEAVYAAGIPYGMNDNAIYSKTGKGVSEASGKTSILSRGDRVILAAIDGKITVRELNLKFDKMPEAKLFQLLEQFDKDGFIRAVSVGTSSAPPPKAAPGKPLPPLPSKPSGGEELGEELDFTALSGGAPAKPASAPPAPPPPPPPSQRRAQPEPPAAPKPPAAKPPVLDLAATARAKAEESQNDMEFDFLNRQAAAPKLQEEAAAKARAEAEAKAKAEALAKARVEAEAKVRAEAQAKAAAAAKAKAEADQKLAAEAAAKAAAEADAKVKAAREAAVRMATEAKAKAEAEAKSKTEASAREAQAAKEAAEKAAQEADALRKQLEEERAKLEAERKSREETDRKSREEAERKAKEDAERFAKEAEERIRKEAEEKARQEAEALRKQLEEERARHEAERKAREEEDRKRREEEERRRKEEDERRAREEAERKAKEEAERKAREEEDRKRKEEDERRAREDAERKAREEADRKAREEADRKAKEEAERRAKEDAERKAKEEAERKAREEAERKAKEDADRQAREAAERKAREEAEAQQRKQDEERRAREESDRAKAEADRKAREDAERKEKEAAAARAKEEGERAAREAAERSRREEEARAKADAERRAKEEAERKAKEAAATPAAAAPAFGDSLLADLDNFGKKEEEEQREREEAERKEKAAAAARAQEEAARAEREAAEQKRREQEERRRKEEEERLAQEELERAKEEAERAAREAEERKKKAKAAVAGAAAGAGAASARPAAKKAEEDDIDLSDADLDMDDVKAEQKMLAKEKAAPKPSRQFDQPVAESIPQAGGKLRKPVNVGKMAAIGLVVVLVGGLGAIHVMPAGTADIEKSASDAFGVPVKIGSANLSLISGPQIKMTNVRVGDALVAPSAIANVGFGSMFGSSKAISKLELQGATLKQAALGGALIGDAKPVGNFSVQRLVANGLKLDGPLALPAIDVDATVGPSGRITALKFTGPDKIVGSVTPKDTEASFEMTAERFTVPFVAGLTLNDFGYKGTVVRDGIRSSTFDSRMFDGVVSGTARIRWGDTWTVDGDLHAKNVGAAVFAPALVSDGRAEAKGTYSMSGPDPTKLKDSLKIDGGFTITKAVIGNFDFAKALTSGGANASGRTQVAEMGGKGSWEKGTVSIRDVQITVGTLNAAIALDISPEGALSGRVVADLKTPQATMRGNFALGGTYKDPQLKKQ